MEGGRECKVAEKIRKILNSSAIQVQQARQSTMDGIQHSERYIQKKVKQLNGRC
jgi:hypothetical protein